MARDNIEAKVGIRVTMTGNNTEKGNGKATGKQVRAIYAIAREQGITRDRLCEIVKKWTGKEIKELSVQEASKVIDRLREIEEANEYLDKNGKNGKELRKKIAAIEERLTVLEVRYEKILSKLIDDIEIKQGVRIAEVEREVRAIRGMLKEYFKEEKSDSEKDDNMNLVCMNCGSRNIKPHEDGGYYCDDCGCFMVKSEEERI